MKNEIGVFINRLNKIGINIETVSNYPWVYLTKINNKPVEEKLYSEHGFTLAFLPLRVDQEIAFSNLEETFKLIKKYI